MYAIYGNIYHQYTPNVSIYTIHGSYGLCSFSNPSETLYFEIGASGGCGASSSEFDACLRVPRSEVAQWLDTVGKLAVPMLADSRC
jgi:hypothetical protein